MDVVAGIAAALLLIRSLVASILTVAYARCFHQWRSEPVADESLPKVALLMGLKGSDPFLADSLARLMTQRYPNYEFHIVVDSRADPAWSTAEEAIRETAADNVRVVEFRDDPADGIVNCTNSKIVQALRDLDDSFEVVAMADGDLVAHPNWLRELVTPLVRDERVGVVTGNRWYMPAEARLGSIVRYLWNAAAAVNMFWFKMAWGGCYAIRTSTIRDGGLVDKWARVAALDMHSTTEMKRLGLDIQFVPSLMAINREECSLPFSLNFIRRQLTWAKLYNPGWAPTAVHTVTGTVSIATALLLIPAGIATGNTLAATIACIGAGTYIATMFIVLMLLEFSVRRIVRQHGEATQWLSPRALAGIVCGIPLTQFVQFIAVALAKFQRHVAWRGAVLDIRGPHDIRVIREQAMPRHGATADTSVSL